MRAATILLAALALASPAPAGDRTEPVRIELPDGTVLAADLRPAKREGSPLVIALPDEGGDRAGFEPFAEPLAEHGIGLVAMDLPGGPERFAEMHSFVERMERRLVARGADPNRIALLGRGTGAAVALHRAAEDERLRAACLLDPRAGLPGVPTDEHLRRWWKRPLLVYGRSGSAPKRIAERGGGELRRKRARGREEEIAAWLAEVLGAPVALDGKLSEAEAEGAVTRALPWGKEKLEVRLRTAGAWLHVALVPEKGPAPTEMDFAWTRDSSFDTARAVFYSDVSGSFTHRVMRDRKWSPIRRRKAPGRPDGHEREHGGSRRTLRHGNRVKRTRRWGHPAEA